MAAGLVAAFACAAGRAHAHAFGERYDLPLPLELYLGGAAAAVVVTFLVIGAFVRDASWLRAYPRLNLLDYRLGRLAVHPANVFVIKLASVLLFVLIVAAGAFGNQDPLRNLAPVMVWIIWWVGMAVVSAFLGDLWAVINPWQTIFACAEALWRRLKPGGELTLGLSYPQALGVWPAVALLLAFTWSELISPRPAVPAYVASMAVAYSLLAWTGMVLFGRERWLRHGEVFAVLFGVLAHFAPTESRIAPDGASAREWALRPFAVGLLRNDDVPASMVAFVLLYLVSVIFDGMLVTPGWAWLEGLAVPLVPAAAGVAATIVRTLGLFGVWLLSAGLYLLTCRAMAAVAGEPAATGAIARRFVFTLIPIAIAYHLAHYLTYLLIQGQHVIPMASDPFGWGWNLFGTGEYRVDLAIVGARFAWYAGVVAIVIGHIVAVILGHARAMAIFSAPRPAFLSQCPLAALMVFLTVASLSILAEPIVQKAPEAAPATSAAAVAVPADAVLPELGSGRLLPVGPGRMAAAKLTYGAMASPFHDGTAMTAADLLYPFSIAYRWSAQGIQAQADTDPAVADATALLRGSLKGLRFVGADPASRTIRFGDLTYARERLLVEVYIDAPAGDVETAAAIAPPWSSLPWHVIALMEEAVGRGWAAFSQAEATRLGVEWLDPVRSEPLKRRLKALVEEFARDGYVPAPLAGMVTPSDARARWMALATFHAKSGHFLVTNGPYGVKSWADGGAVLEVVRDPRYPLGVGSYDSYAIPRRAYVVKAEPGAEGLVLAVEIDTIDRVMRDYKIARLTLRDAIAAFGKGAIPQCHYVVVDGDGGVALAGQGRFRDDGAMVVDLKGKLAPGRYTVSVALYPNGNTMDAEIRRIPYEVPQAP